ncbi:uncharacterized protein PAN0_003d1736 [Moesziomyces antarcticus]|uniref:DUF7888 domain-containing protein n=1 Tax=Pseudozyma antarctica TaxID=84753 RepID=A0A5C3FKP7_PSEA2|nr:uncharacterized protein PAN0_003d1736 [Moesziomyces antarcticus]GAK63531.1 hypothetical protein PAN0_003d1736 [Moesziomyces antarcticus]SPO44121.1 uncharacterized protein PSANT_01806 [Moesziomyces antarcticus]
MLLLKLATVFALMAATPAIGGSVNPGVSRSACISQSVDRARARASQADAVVCYHGEYDIVNKDGNTFGLLFQVQCGEERVNVDCFWMDGPAIFNGHDDGGSDNLGYSMDTTKCQFSSFWRSVKCQG